MPYKLCWCFAKLGLCSVTHKKGAGRPIVRTEEIVTINKLKRTFSNPCPPLTRMIFDIPVDFRFYDYSWLQKKTGTVRLILH
jgi:hypothetical protein